VDELSPGDVQRFIVVRIADEVVADLMANSCGIDYATASQSIIHRDIEGVQIPFASPELLWRMKQTLREKDIPDRAFLRGLLDLPPHSGESTTQPSLLDRLRRWFGKG
jgi:hypothetical protein